MKIKKIDGTFAVCKVKYFSKADLSRPFTFAAATDEEFSLVCPEDNVPVNAYETDLSWRAFRIEGVLDFSLIGILSKISGILAEERIGIFAVSTYNTDYILVKSENFERALSALSEKGYEVI